MYVCFPSESPVDLCTYCSGCMHVNVSNASGQPHLPVLPAALPVADAGSEGPAAQAAKGDGKGGKQKGAKPEPAAVAKAGAEVVAGSEKETITPKSPSKQIKRSGSSKDLEKTDTKVPEKAPDKGLAAPRTRRNNKH